MASKADSTARVRVVNEETLQLEQTQPSEPSPSVLMPQFQHIPPLPSEEKQQLIYKDKAGQAPNAGSPRVPETMTTEARSLSDLSRAFQLMMGVCLTVSMVLAVRFMLLVAVLMSAGLTWLAMQNPTLMSLSLTTVFNVAVVIPIVALYWRRG